MIIFILFFRGLLACAGFFLVFGMTQTPDGVFVRPHPGKLISFFSNDLITHLFLLALWRLVLCFSVLYEIVLIYILFQVS